MTTVLATPPATNTLAANLLLVRMGFNDPSPKKVRVETGKLLDRELSEAEFADLRNQLVSEGFLVKGRRSTFSLTDAGRERACRFVGVPELPAKTTWSAFVNKHLFPKAAGLSADAAAKLKSGGMLAAIILKRKYGLASEVDSTIKAVVEALACRELGFPEEKTLDGLVSTVLSRRIGSKLSRKQLLEQLPLFETGLTEITADKCRVNIVRQWLAGSPPVEQSPESTPPDQVDLNTFAATVRALAASSPPEDRFHDNKVFIAPLWRASQRESSFPRVTLPEFKQQLIEANARHLIHLSRADLVQVMDPQLVAESEASYLNATFHFVLVEGTGQ